jgi:hypothetical protein
MRQQGLEGAHFHKYCDTDKWTTHSVTTNSVNKMGVIDLYVTSYSTQQFTRSTVYYFKMAIVKGFYNCPYYVDSPRSRNTADTR